MEILKTDNLSKHFGGIKAVNNVSFSVKKGERLAIIGPNGAGKTTLFNLLNGQYQVTSGKVYLLGRDITRMPTYKRANLGMSRSYQTTTLFPKLTVFENVRLAIQGNKKFRYQMFHPVTAYKEMPVKAEELLQTVGLPDRKDTEVESLSHGEQRRLEIALSLASDPKLLLLDEPSAGLTTAESAEIVKVLRDLKEDITVIIIGHDMDLVFGVAERIIVLCLGEYMCDGTCEETRNNPKVKEIYLGTEGGEQVC